MGLISELSLFGIYDSFVLMKLFFGLLITMSAQRSELSMGLYYMCGPFQCLTLITTVDCFFSLLCILLARQPIINVIKVVQDQT
jgi:hypothetical protein